MTELISIIIPIYNSCEYLDKCLDSVVKQKYQQLEIILVNDGSTDNSLDICQKYAESDKRIKVFSKDNEGQGKARNFGLEQCTGNYIMFVDSDDWLDESIVEKLYVNINQHNSNIAVCNYLKTYLDCEDKFFKVEEKIDDRSYIDLSQERNMLEQISVYPWGKLYRTKIFKENKIEFPNHFFEDAAVMPVVYILSKTISFINEALYYYRNHSGNTVNSIQRMDDRIQCIGTLIETFKQRGLYDDYGAVLSGIVEKRMQINVRMVKNTLSSKYKEFVREQNNVVQKYFAELSMQNTGICVWGSYNLMTVAKIIMNYESDRTIEHYYGRESIVSIVSGAEKINKYDVFHQNPMKWSCLVNDFSKRFANSNVSEFRNIRYVFIDLLEERFDLGKYEENYFTISDAFLEIQKQMDITYEKIKAFSEQWFDLWEKACTRFVQMLLQRFKPEQIILVRMKLTEQYVVNGEKKYFADIDDIRHINNYLDKCYDSFARLNDKIIDIEVANLKCYSTSKEFRHGCYPWHLGNMAYEKVGRYIADQIRFQEEIKIGSPSR